jgi:hypothetical protein
MALFALLCHPLIEHVMVAHPYCTPLLHTLAAHPYCTPLLHTAHPYCTPSLHTHDGCTPLMPAIHDQVVSARELAVVAAVHLGPAFRVPRLCSQICTLPTASFRGSAASCSLPLPSTSPCKIIMLYPLTSPCKSLAHLLLVPCNVY